MAYIGFFDENEQLHYTFEGPWFECKRHLNGYKEEDSRNEIWR